MCVVPTRLGWPVLAADYERDRDTVRPHHTCAQLFETQLNAAANELYDHWADGEDDKLLLSTMLSLQVRTCVSALYEDLRAQPGVVSAASTWGRLHHER